MNPSLLVPSELIEHLIDLARAAAPHEVVGILGGVGSQVHEVIELSNQLQGAPTPSTSATAASAVHPRTGELLSGSKAGFLVDPREQFRAERALAAREHDIVAIYHSHPGGGPTLSPSDIAYARRWPVAHVVLAVSRPDGRWDEVRAYRVTDRIAPLRLQTGRLRPQRDPRLARQEPSSSR